MAAVAHGIAVQSTLQTHTGDTAWWTAFNVPAANFVAGGKYLFICSAQFWGSATAVQFNARLVHGAVPTDFGDSQFALFHPLATNVHENYAFMGVWTQPGTAEDVTFQISTASAAQTVSADTIVIFWMRLDSLTENTDYFYNDLTTDITHTDVYQKFAQVTLTPGSQQDYLVIGWHEADIQHITKSMSYRLNRDDVDITPEYFDEPTNLAELWARMLLRVWNLTNASHVISIDGKDESTAGAENIHLRSHLFILRLDKFKEHSFYYNAADFVPGATGWSEIGAFDITPTVAADFLLMGGVNIYTSNVSIFGSVSIRKGGVATPVGREAYTSGVASSDTTDVWCGSTVAMEALPTSAQTLRLYGCVSDVTMRPRHRSAVAVSMELASTSIFYKIFTEAVNNHTETLKKKMWRLFTETVSNYTSTLVCRTKKPFTEIADYASTLVCKVGKLMVEAASHTETLLKRSWQTFAETADLVENLTKGLLLHLTFGEAASLAEALVKLPRKVFSETASHAEVLVSKIGKLMVETIDLAESFAKSLLKHLAFLESTGGDAVWATAITYVGNGQANHHIEGVGFPPAAVLIVNSTRATEPPGFRHKDFPAGMAVWIGGSLGFNTNLISSLDANGFTVEQDSSTNGAGETYHAFCLREAVGKSKIATYVGDGTNLQAIVNAGFGPKAAIIHKNNNVGAAREPMWKGSSFPLSHASFFGNQGNGPYIGNSIRSLDANGFTVEGSAHVLNELNTTYYYLLLGGDQVAEGFYVGNGLDDQVHDLGDAVPIHMWLKDPATARVGLFRNVTHTTDKCAQFKGAQEPVTNAIQRFPASDFEVGTADTVNTSPITYRYAAIGSGGGAGMLVESLVRRAGKVFDEAATLAEGLVRGARKLFVEAVDLAEAFVVQLATGLQYLSFAETAVLAEAITQQTRKLLGETANFTEAQTRKVGMVLAEAISVGETLLKLTGKHLAETVAIGESLLRGFFLVMGESFVMDEALVKRIGKLLSETAEHAEALVKITGKKITEAVSIAEGLVAGAASEAFAEGVLMVEALTKIFISGSVSVVRALRKSRIWRSWDD